MPKVARRKPSLAPTPWDLGPDTAQQRANTVTEAADYTDPETGKKVNPNGVKRRRRLSWVEIYHNKGKLTARQADAGKKLAEAWEATQRSAPAIKKVQVDSSPKPDAHVAIMVDRISRYHRLRRSILRQHRPFIEHVVLNNCALASMPGRNCADQEARMMDRLREGLDRLADVLDGK